MTRFFDIYQYLAPLLLTPLAYFLWLSRLRDDHPVTLLVLSIPVVAAYVVPAIGTNYAQMWEFNTRFRIGKFRPHHGFVFGSAMAVLALWCVAPATDQGPGQDGVVSLGTVLRAALVTGSTMGFWNWIYDAAAIRAGFLAVYTKSYGDNGSPEAVSLDYAPAFFGTFGACYGAAIVLAEGLMFSNDGRRLYWPLLIGAQVATILLPTLVYMAVSYVRFGEWGLTSYKQSARSWKGGASE